MLRNRHVSFKSFNNLVLALFVLVDVVNVTVGFSVVFVSVALLVAIVAVVTLFGVAVVDGPFGKPSHLWMELVDAARKLRWTPSGGK